MSAVEPVLHKSLSAWLESRAFTLGDFVLVMRKHQILAAEMKVEAGAENLHAHGAALDVPARPAFAPGTGPENVAVLWNPRLPQCEIGQGFFCVFVALHPFTDAHFFKVKFHQLAVGAAAA